MKKLRFGHLLIILLIIVLGFSGCNQENKKSDAQRIALNEFSLEEILVITPGSSGSSIMSEDTARYPIYVLGVKDDKEIFIIVPVLKYQKAYTVDWVFNESFREIMTRLNSTEKGEVCSKSDYERIEFFDNEESIQDFFPDIAIQELDVKFMIVFEKYGIVQMKGKVVIYEQM